MFYTAKRLPDHKTCIDVYEQAEHVHKQNLQPLLLPQTASLEINNAVLKAYLQLDTQIKRPVNPYEGLQAACFGFKPASKHYA